MDSVEELLQLINHPVPCRYCESDESMIHNYEPPAVA